MPVQKARAESSWYFTRESMEGVKDKWVQGRGGRELVSEGGVNQVDKEGIREEGDCFIVCVRGRYVIWTMG